MKKYGVTNYTIEDGVIIIDGSLDLTSLTEVDKDFLKGATINGGLHLDSLTEAHKDFLRGATINGFLDLRSLTEAHKDFLRGATINGNLYLNSLIKVDKNFLEEATINRGLYLNSLKKADRDILNGNVKQLNIGYNKEQNYCFFDGILSKVLSVKETRGYVIYTTPFGFIAQKDDETAHGKTVKKAISDLEFKFIAEKLKKEPIKEDTIITDQYYRLVTGACEQGITSWKRANNVDADEVKAMSLLVLLEKTNAYGLDRFKQLVDWN